MKLLLENWRKYLNEEEELKNPIYLFHGTRTMPDMSNIESFRKGVTPREGVPGRRGWYVFTDKGKVEQRLRGPTAILGDYAERYRSFHPESDGYPMIVTVKVDQIEPEKWDLDAEVSHKIITRGLIDTLEEWRPKLKDLPVPAGIDWFFKGKPGILRFTQAERGEYDEEEYLQIPFEFEDRKGRPRIRKIRLGLEDRVSLGNDAAKRSSIFSIIQHYAPEVIHKMEKEAFIEALKTPTAIKYVGKDLLPVEQLEAYVNDQWVDVTSQNPSPMELEK